MFLKHYGRLKWREAYPGGLFEAVVEAVAESVAEVVESKQEPKGSEGIEGKGGL